MTELAKILDVAASSEYLEVTTWLRMELSIAPATIYRARDKGALADKHCVKVARILGIDPIIVMAAKHADSSRGPDVQKAWRGF